MIRGIQLPLFPATRQDNIDVRPLLGGVGVEQQFWRVPARKNRPVWLHYIPLYGVWAVSTMAGIIGPSGRVGAKIEYIYPRTFLLHEEGKAISFAMRASEPRLEQSYEYAMNCILNRERILPYEGYA